MNMQDYAHKVFLGLSGNYPDGITTTDLPGANDKPRPGCELGPDIDQDELDLTLQTAYELQEKLQWMKKIHPGLFKHGYELSVVLRAIELIVDGLEELED